MNKPITFGRVEGGVVVEQIIRPAGAVAPGPEWLPIIVEIPEYDSSKYREAGRSNRIEAAKIVRTIDLERIVPTHAEYEAAVEAHIDAIARSLGYSGQDRLAGFVNDPVHGPEALEFVKWRGLVWNAAISAMNTMHTAQSLSEFIAALPEIEGQN